MIGVYDHPPPAEAGDVIYSQQLADFGAVAAAEYLTRTRDRVVNKLGDWIDAL